MPRLNGIFLKIFFAFLDDGLDHFSSFLEWKFPFIFYLSCSDGFPKCVVWCHDMAGFNAGDRTRQLVDKMAETTGWCVVLPNFLGQHKVGGDD